MSENSAPVHRVSTEGHTPLPWEVTCSQGEGLLVRGPGRVIARMDWNITDARDEANAALIVHRVNSWDRLMEALNVQGIRRLEDDVRHYSGNEASGYAEINRRKAEAWDSIAALTEAGRKA